MWVLKGDTRSLDYSSCGVWCEKVGGVPLYAPVKPLLNDIPMRIKAWVKRRAPEMYEDDMI